MCWGTEKQHSWVKEDFLPSFLRCLPSSWKESARSPVPCYMAPSTCDCCPVCSQCLNLLPECSLKSKTLPALKNVSSESQAEKHDDYIP